MSILEMERGVAVTNIRNLLLDYIEKAIVLHRDFKNLTKILKEILQSPTWRFQVDELEKQFQSNESDYKLASIDSSTLLLIQYMLGLKKDDKNQFDRAMKVFFKTPKISSWTDSQTRVFNLLESHVSPFFKIDNAQSSEDFENDRTITDTILKVIEPSVPELQVVKLELQLRLETIHHFLDLRKFIKIDALRYKWPQLGQILQTHPQQIKDLEASILLRQSTKGEINTSLDHYLKDEEFCSFILLRPHFRDFLYEVKKYASPLETFSPSSSFTKEIELPVNENISSTDSASQIIDQTNEKMTKQANSVLPETQSNSIVPTYENLLITVEKTSVPGANDTEQYRVSFHNDNGEITKSEDVMVDWRVIEDARTRLERVSWLGGTTRNVMLAREIDYAEEFSSVGKIIFDTFFPGNIVDIRKILQKGKRLRILLHLQNPKLYGIPWESLYSSEFDIHLALNKNCSIVRRIKQVNPFPATLLRSPIRILAVFASPKNLAPLAIDAEVEVIQKVIKDAVLNKKVDLRILAHEQATVENFQRNLRDFQPNVLHFVGHSGFEEDQAKFFFVASDGLGHALSSRDIKTLLSGSPISLIVLNGCHTGAAETSEIAENIAGRLVGDGVPVVVATTNAIEDRAAILFSREFYSSITNTFNIEEALLEARRALFIERWNWATYALFSNVKKLEAFGIEHNLFI